MKLTDYYRGADTALAMERLPDGFLKELRALSAQEGNLVVLEVAGDRAFEGATAHTVHPLLVFAELVIVGAAALRYHFGEQWRSWSLDACLADRDRSTVFKS
jgi:hypothetical protein